MAEQTYRSRWEACDDCDVVTIVERNDDRGVPDPDEWASFGQCMVCGGSLLMGNADEKTQGDMEYAKGKRAATAMIEAGLRTLVETYADQPEGLWSLLRGMVAPEAADDLAARLRRSTT